VYRGRRTAIVVLGVSSGYGGRMPATCPFLSIDGRAALSLLVALVVLRYAAQAVGLCIVFRRGRSAVPGCVPAWSADRAPPRLRVV
jgi:hypothetical protein